MKGAVMERDQDTGRDRRRRELLCAARDLYQEKGLSKTSVQDITDRVGVTRSLFYHYFDDKDAITAAVLDDYVSDYVEALSYWNERRAGGDIDQALLSLVRLTRGAILESDSFRSDLNSKENASLYLGFINRVADHTARYIIDTTARDYQARHRVEIDHLYETFYMLITGVIGLLRNHPDVDDQTVADVVAQTLHIHRSQE